MVPPCFFLHKNDLFIMFSNWNLIICSRNKFAISNLLRLFVVFESIFLRLASADNMWSQRCHYLMHVLHTNDIHWVFRTLPRRGKPQLVSKLTNGRTSPQNRTEIELCVFLSKTKHFVNKHGCTGRQT